MEDNNSFLIKTIAGALILILALNVYRTESTKKQMDRLAATVDNLSVRLLLQDIQQTVSKRRSLMNKPTVPQS